ncbi:acetate kinase [Nocardioides sp. Root122]|uniref:acetate/propionate family kinase n=1 Tax=Nocardioides TaxID=1839 RepID=UPI000702430E|nr:MULTISPECIES: acetate kinase [Nocardioides]KQV67756.1 acetate kinase [Nocardioides sp. Root122]MCK9823633.1 acetate kinase [Nocardioides cavernae]
MTNRVLVLNAGSSSLKYRLLDGESGAAEASGSVERIGEESGTLTHSVGGQDHTEERRIADFDDALRSTVEAFRQHGPAIDQDTLAAVGHRVVHGGDLFSAPVVVDDRLLDTVADLVPLAPLHNPANLEGLRVSMELFPDVPQVAVFDTAFHQTMPEHAYTYAVPVSWREEHRIRRYGFHGTSYAFVSRRAAELLDRPVDETNLVVLHLGNGASAAAVRGGRSIDTSMGLTPLEGLVMGTRSGDLDPAIHGHLHRELGWSLEEVDRALYRESGLLGLAGANDFREVTRRRAAGDAAATLAFDVYAYRVRKYVGAYYAALGELHAVVFTGGVGQHSAELRAAALDGLTRLGIELDPARNEAPSSDARAVSADGSEVAVLVVPTDEEWEIARQALEVVRGS